QRKNHLIFKDVPGMMENIVRVGQHIREKLVNANVTDVDRRVITHIPTNSDAYFFQDDSGNYWTLCLNITNSRSVELIENPHQAWLTGKAFGQFQNQLADLPAPPLHETIVDFHNIEFRYRNFRKALEINYDNRAALVEKEIDFVLAHETEMHTLLQAQRSGLIPMRITHNDTKINNVLFDENNNVLCVIDLDTVMPGLVHFDFGDAIRTGASTAAADETDLDKMTIDLHLFEAFTKGFLEETKAVLTPSEIGFLPHSAKFMTFIMGLRFLTDYLDGDVYYKIKHPEHNVQRARAQFRLVAGIGKNEDKMKEMVAGLV
ncbi:MAG TPA: aminoglycoside phosphotransferase family protein, partial [Bacteroidales bacterium]|nr:aminoglycoside phosphotransferase family protein [Bacteroidales bacterium]